MLEAAAGKSKKSAANVINDPTQSLQTFDLLELQQYTQERVHSTTASKDFHLFYVGRDDVHTILKYVLSRVSISLYLNMFGYDDDELNDILMKLALDPTVTMLITLDKSQASGKHEKSLLDLDRKKNLALFNTHVAELDTPVREIAIGQSSTRQISHTKGFVADGKVAGEGSTNWSASGEGRFVTPGKAGGPGYKAQNNTQSIITDPDTISRFSAELVAEHMIAQKQSATEKQKSGSSEVASARAKRVGKIVSALAILRLDRDMPEARCRISPQRVRRLAHHRIDLVVR
jgi:hypothetical protein